MMMKSSLNFNKFGEKNDQNKKINELLKNIGNLGNNHHHLDLIYENIILNKNYSLKFYNILPNREIWFGKLENYFKSDDVIIETFVVGLIYDWIYIIMNKDDCIHNIRSIINNKIINCDDCDFWNIDGSLMRNDQKITEIDTTNQYYRIIINCRDGDNIDRSFNDCRQIYDRLLMDQLLLDINYYNWQYYDNDKINELFNNTMTKEIMKRLLLFIDNNKNSNELFIDNLFSTAACFRNSKFLFYNKMIFRYQIVFDEFWQLMQVEIINEMGPNSFQLLQDCVRLSCYNLIMDSINDNVFSVQVFNDHQSNIDIFNNGFNKYLIGQLINIRYLIKLIGKHFLIQNRLDFEIDDIIDEMLIEGDNNREIDIIFKGSIVISIKIPKIDIKKNKQFKNLISNRTAIPTIELLLINPEENDTLNYGDSCVSNDNLKDLKIEIMCYMDDVVNLEEIGSGSFANIYLYPNEISEKLFVLKVPKRKGDHLKDINFFYRMGESNIANCYKGVYRYRGKICMAMEYFSGGTLTDYIKDKKPLSEQEIAIICHQLLLQIEEIHKNKIVHRDIKSDNIVFDEHNNVKLIDFGMWKSINKIEENEKDKGNYYYSAPESLNDEKYNEKIDIWSFGAVVIEMITGEMPFKNLQLIQVFREIKENKKIEFIPPPGTSEELLQFINNCTQPNAIDRPSAKQLIQSIFINKYCNSYQ